MSENFRLSPDFETTSTPLVGLDLCDARLMNDSRFVWVVLVPREADRVEIDDLSAQDQSRLFQEMVATGQRVRGMALALGRPVEKLNFGQLGNVTRQLHVHVIGRRTDDAAWPRPVWGVGEAIPWPEGDRALLKKTWSENV